ncbi:hypothetical protein K525DRAFT_235429 [Schizophyllum commune Loenen D]|nr:hypothetical protein K525DRAFT_235429 [Schizophyllum commune Loenen D]
MSSPKFMSLGNLMSALNITMRDADVPHNLRAFPNQLSGRTTDTMIGRSPDTLTGRSAQDDAQSRSELLDRTLHTLAKRSSNSGTVIAGVVVGVVAFLLICGGVYGWWRMRERRRTGPPKEMMEERGGVEEDMDDGDHYDADIQNAADNGVRGSKLYGPSGHRNTMILDGPVVFDGQRGSVFGGQRPRASGDRGTRGSREHHRMASGDSQRTRVSYDQRPRRSNDGGARGSYDHRPSTSKDHRRMASDDQGATVFGEPVVMVAPSPGHTPLRQGFTAEQ